MKSRAFEAQKRAVRYGKAKVRSFSKPHRNSYTVISAANECNVAVRWKNFRKSLIQRKHTQRNFNGYFSLYFTDFTDQFIKFASRGPLVGKST